MSQEFAINATFCNIRVMTRSDDTSKARPKVVRSERLAAALRENLRKRKAQARSRREQPAEDGRAPDATQEDAQSITREAE